MLRQSIAISLLLIFSAQLFNRAVMRLDYFVNTSNFAKNCVNKSRPVLACNGKCQLMKKIKQAEEKEQQNPERNLAYKNEVISSRSFFGNITFTNLSSARSFGFYFKRCILQGFPGKIFHPPGLA